MKPFAWIQAGISLMMAGIIVILGCSREPENPAWFQSTSTGDLLSEEVLRTKIDQIENIFAIYRMKEEYSLHGGESKVIADLLRKRWEELLAEQPPPQAISPAVDLVAFDYKIVQPGEYRADFICRANNPLDNEYWVALHGIVDESNRHLLSKARREENKKSEKWSFKPNPPTTAWPVGEYVLFSQTVSAPPIPYDMFILLYGRDGKSGRYGNRIQLGRYGGISEDEMLIEIKGASDPIDLYRLRNENMEERSPAIRVAFEDKSNQLLEDKKFIGSISPEADLMAFNYKKIGSERYRIDFLFKVNQPFRRDYKIGLYGVVDDNHRDFLTEGRRRKGKKSEAWTFWPDIPTSLWPVGEYVLISSRIMARPIPYNMHVILFDAAKKSGRYGQRVDLGWRVSLDDLQSVRE